MTYEEHWEQTSPQYMGNLARIVSRLLVDSCSKVDWSGNCIAAEDKRTLQNITDECETIKAVRIEGAGNQERS